MQPVIDVASAKDIYRPTLNPGEQWLAHTIPYRDYKVTTAIKRLCGYNRIKSGISDWHSTKNVTANQKLYASWIFMACYGDAMTTLKKLNEFSSPLLVSSAKESIPSLPEAEYSSPLIFATIGKIPPSQKDVYNLLTSARGMGINGFMSCFGQYGLLYDKPQYHESMKQIKKAGFNLIVWLWGVIDSDWVAQHPEQHNNAYLIVEKVSKEGGLLSIPIQKDRWGSIDIKRLDYWHVYEKGNNIELKKEEWNYTGDTQSGTVAINKTQSGRTYEIYYLVAEKSIDPAYSDFQKHRLEVFDKFFRSYKEEMWGVMFDSVAYPYYEPLMGYGMTPYMQENFAREEGCKFDPRVIRENPVMTEKWKHFRTETIMKWVKKITLLSHAYQVKAGFYWGDHCQGFPVDPASLQEMGVDFIDGWTYSAFKNKNIQGVQKRVSKFLAMDNVLTRTIQKLISSNFCRNDG